MKKKEQRQLTIDKQQTQKEQNLNAREQRLDREVDRKVNLKFNENSTNLKICVYCWNYRKYNTIFFSYLAI